MLRNIKSLIPLALRLFARLRLGRRERQIVHARHMTSLVPDDGCVLMALHGLGLVDLVLLEQIEEGLVSAMSERTQLIVIPLLLEDVLGIDFFVASKSHLVYVGARLTHVDTDPKERMCRLVLFAIDAIPVEWHLQLLGQIVIQRFRLIFLARGDEVWLGILRLRLLLLEDLLGLDRCGPFDLRRARRRLLRLRWLHDYS